MIPDTVVQCCLDKIFLIRQKLLTGRVDAVNTVNQDGSKVTLQINDVGSMFDTTAFGQVDPFCPFLSLATHVQMHFSATDLTALGCVLASSILF
jgi:hypothetical protein